MFGFVVLVGLSAAWLIGPHVDVSVSGLAEVSEALGFVQIGAAPRHLVGYDANAKLTQTDLNALNDANAALTGD